MFFYSPGMLLRPVCCWSNLDKSETATRSQAFRRIYPVASLSPSAGAGGAAVRDAAEQLLRQLSVSNGCLHARNFLDVVDTENAHTQIVSAAPFCNRWMWHERGHVEPNYSTCPCQDKVFMTNASFPVIRSPNRNNPPSSEVLHRTCCARVRAPKVS